MTSPFPPNTAWPPPQVADYVREWAEWAAWWAGDPSDLAKVSSGEVAGAAGDAGGGRFGRFWARSRRTIDTHVAPARNYLHVPLAADVAQTSADLLFGEEPGLVVDGDQKAQDALDGIVETTGLINLLHYGAEMAAGLGGVYLRPVWDTTVADHPLTTAIGQDQAIPEIRLGVLVAVTFWEVLSSAEAGENDQVMFRHLERHEPGRIVHTLHKGTEAALGDVIPLAEHPATRGLAGLVDAESAIDTSMILDTGLLVSYVPNAPSRRWRNRGVGRADVAGLGPLLDALDETYTSWMRDIRLAKARILVADGLLDVGRRSDGAVARGFDVDNEVFSELPGLDGMAAGAQPITLNQFAIRVKEHQDTAQSLVEQIVTSAGWAPQTFGLHTEGALSGTAHQLRELKTHRTTGRKQRAWKPAVEHHTLVLLAINRAVFKGPAEKPVSLTWPENDVDEPKNRAETVEILRRAEAVSMETAVRLAQPQLDETEVAAEVRRIKADRSGTLDDGDPQPGDEPTFGAPDRRPPVVDDQDDAEVEGE